MRPSARHLRAMLAVFAGWLPLLSCDAPTGADTQDVTVLVGSLSSPERNTPLIGLNTNAHHAIATWTLGWFRDSTAVLLPAVLRYPGGTTANHWDWQTGWFTADSTTPPTFAGITPTGMVRAEEFKPGMDEAGARPLLVVNVQHSTLAYQLAGLAHAASVGIPVEMVELGNEHNLGAANQFMPPGVYAPLVRTWSDSIKAHYPNAKIAAVGGEPPNQPGWHDSIFSFSPPIDALAFHIYLGAGNDDGVFDAKRALSQLFASSGGLLNRYAMSGFDSPPLPTDVEVWVTEYNLGEVLAGAAAQHAGTWTHALYVSAMSHLLMTLPEVTMLVNHNLTNTLDFAAIDPQTGRITANGVAMILLGSASRGRARAAQIMFADQLMVTSGGTTYPSLVAWRFSGGAPTAAWLLNLSGDRVTVNLGGTGLGSTFTYRVYSADPALVVDGLASVVLAAGTSSGNVALPGFSIAVLGQ